MLKLKENSLDWALNNIIKFNDTYVFPKPFEIEAITESWSEVKNYLKELDVYAEGVRPYRTAVTPKSRLGFRISTQLDPLDSIIYSGIIYEIYEDIERTRLPKEKELVLSFRLNPLPDGTLYDEEYNWDRFKEREKDLAESEDYKYVIVTDIADFYPSIYLHNIETALRECVKSSGKSTHAECLINIIKAMHLNQTHKGLPVGPQFSRPIAELILDTVDRVLDDQGFNFIRYVDDYRIYCNSESEAYEKLAFLAQKLYDLLNLKLNEQKTKILTIEKFTNSYLKTHKDKVEDSVLEHFYELVAELGISINPYEDVDLDSLDEDDLKRLREFNIVDVLEEELKREEIDLGFISTLLGNLARFDNTEVADLILKEENIRRLFPILKSIITYLERVRSFDAVQKHTIGKQMLDVLQNSFIGQLQFNRAWILSLFTKGEEWDNQVTFTELLKNFNDNATTTRKLYLALGRAKNIRYFRENKQLNTALDPWAKRAFIAAISCLPEDERRPWYKSRSLTSRDFLEKIIEKWAIKNHF